MADQEKNHLTVDDLTAEELASIHRGMVDRHFGRSFSLRMVKGLYQGFLLKRLFYRLCIRAKKIRWAMMEPIHRLTHRHCPECAKLCIA